MPRSVFLSHHSTSREFTPSVKAVEAAGGSRWAPHAAGRRLDPGLDPQGAMFDRAARSQRRGGRAACQRCLARAVHVKLAPLQMGLTQGRARRPRASKFGGSTIDLHRGCAVRPRRLVICALAAGRRAGRLLPARGSRREDSRRAAVPPLGLPFRSHPPAPSPSVPRRRQAIGGRSITKGRRLLGGFDVRVVAVKGFDITAAALTHNLLIEYPPFILTRLRRSTASGGIARQARSRVPLVIAILAFPPSAIASVIGMTRLDHPDQPLIRDQRRTPLQRPCRGVLHLSRRPNTSRRADRRSAATRRCFSAFCTASISSGRCKGSAGDPVRHRRSSGLSP